MLAGCGYRPVPGGDAGLVPDIVGDGPIPCPIAHVPMRLVKVDSFVYAATGAASTKALHGRTLAVEQGAVFGAAVAVPKGQSSDPLKALEGWAVAFERAAYPATVAVRSSGTRGKSAEGLADVKEALWGAQGMPRQSTEELRNRLLTLLTGTTFPHHGGGPTAEDFVIKLTVVARAQDFLITFAVISQQLYDQPLSPHRALLDDLGNGTAVASKGRALESSCHLKNVGKEQKKADILWVVDESGSTNDNRAAIQANADRFFSKALAAGLDFRMGITGMVDPRHTPGKLCSRASKDKSDDGGVDRFLSSKEKALFSACIQNPPYRVSSQEYGLANIFEGVQRHLPRAERNDRFRPGASIVIIVVTDEAPQELKLGSTYKGQTGFLSSSELKKNNTNCALTADKQSRLDVYLKPWVELLSGSDVGAKLHLIGGSCGSSCNAELPFGYQDLAHRLGGQTADICQPDLGATLQVIVDSITAGASAGRLVERPVSASLTVEVDGKPVARRGHASGGPSYSYSAVENTLTFYDLTVSVGSRIVASYHRFVTP